MKGKRIAAVLFSLVLVSGMLAACGGGNNEGSSGGATNAPAPTPAATPAATQDGKWTDGVYYAEADEFSGSGWKEVVGLTVENGVITSVNWTGLHKDGGMDKKAFSLAGKYGMTKGGAQAEWHEQAEKAEQFLLEKQDPAAFAVKDDGKTDAVSGVSVTVSEFVELVNKALAAGPVERGPYKDGMYRAEEKEFGSSGWKYTADITVLNGRIISADWNGIYKDGGDDKDTQSASGAYGMVAKGGAQAEWHEQALKAEQYLLETQDPKAITYTDDAGHTDAISGVSIHVVEFFDLAEEALSSAK